MAVPSANTQRLRVIANPASNHGRSSKRWASIRDRLEGAGDIDWCLTERPGHAVELAASARSNNCTGVVAIGGDGTVNEVVNGLMTIAPPDRPYLGVIPCGSGNDFAWASKVGPRVDRALQQIVAGDLRPVDIGQITHPTHGSRYFANSAGMFIVAAISIRAREMKRLHGLAMYVAATIKSIAHDFDAVPIRLIVDGVESSHEVIMLSVGNGAREGGGFMTNPSARNDDGLFNFMLSSRISRLRMLRLLPSIMMGRQERHSCVLMGTGSTISISASEAVAVHLDGEVWATTSEHLRELRFDIHPGAIRVLR